VTTTFINPFITDQLEGQSNKYSCSTQTEGRTKHTEYNVATKTQTAGEHA